MKPETDQTNAEPIDPPRSEPPTIELPPRQSKTAYYCPWGHQPMWVINGDWDNPDVRCGEPTCPASGKAVSPEVWNQWHRRLAVVPEADACGWVPEERCGVIFYGTSCKVGEIAYENEPNFDQHPFCPGCGRRVEVKEGEG